MPAPRCTAKRTDGAACQAPGIDGGECFWHSEIHRAAQRAAAQKGGLRRTIELPSSPALTPEKTRELIAAASEAVVRGALDPTTLRSLGYLLSVDRQLRDSEALNTRMAELEAQLESVTALPNVHRDGHQSGGSMKDMLKAKLKRVGDRRHA